MTCFLINHPNAAAAPDLVGNRTGTAAGYAVNASACGAADGTGLDAADVNKVLYALQSFADNTNVSDDCDLSTILERAVQAVIDGQAGSLGGTITPGALTISTGAAVNETLTSSNGVAPFVATVSAGTLPAGLTLDANTGAITGTPTGAAGTPYSFTIRLTDANGDYNEQVYSGTIVGSDFGGTIAPATVTLASGAAANETFVASGGTGVAPYTYSVQAGALPAGLTLDTNTGDLTGTPTGAAGTAYNFTIRATDANGNYTDQAYSGTLAASGPPATYPNVNPFSFTGADQAITIPATAEWMRVRVIGAGGANGGNGVGPAPGGFVEAEYALDGSVSVNGTALAPGVALAVMVGEGGIPGGAAFTYGFGGRGVTSGPVGASATGAGLSGVFVGGGAIADTDAARAIAIGGGASGADSTGPSSGPEGQPGGDANSGGQATMSGHDKGGGGGFGGGGGGGHTGGQAWTGFPGDGLGNSGRGGANFLAPGAFSSSNLFGTAGNAASPTVDTDFAGFGGGSSTDGVAGQNGYIIIEFDV